jgi:hypothetical protein
MGLIWEINLPTFLLVTVALAGGAGYMAGRSAALTWRSAAMVIVYSAGLACAARFIHMALFGGTLLTPHYWLVDFVVILIIGLLAFRATRANQMVRQYSWLYERTGPFGWRKKAAQNTVN